MQAVLKNKGFKHAFNLVGSQHKYQIQAAIIIAIQYVGPSLFLAYLSFLDQFPTFVCKNVEDPWPDMPESRTIQFELYCHGNYMRPWTQICVAGLIGAGLSSFVSDYSGRKMAMFFSYTLTSFSILLAFLSEDMMSFNVFFKLIGLGIGGYVSVSVTYLSEIGSERFARVASAIAFLVIAAGGFMMAVIISSGSDEKTFFLGSLGISIIVSFFGFHFLDETPMFLYRNKETGKVLQTLEKIAMTNSKLEGLGANVQANGVFRFADDSEAEGSRKFAQRWNYLQILKHPQLKYRVLIYSLIRLFISLAFWASFSTIFTQNQAETKLMGLGSIAEIIGGLLSLTVYAVPIRSLLKKSLLAVLVLCFCFFLIPCFSAFWSELLMSTILAFIVKACLSFIRGYIYNMGNELFPVEVRSQCNGIVEILAQSAGPLVPVIFMLANITTSWLIIGVIGLACLGLSDYLPQEELATLEKSDEIELNLDDSNPKIDYQPLIVEY